MKPALFDYHRADGVEDVLRHLAANDGAKLIAGGQSFGPMLNMRLASPALLIDINDLSELATIRDTGPALTMGPLTRHHQLAESPLVQRHCPLLAQAARTIGHYAIRQRGTLGGSLAHADPAAQLPLVAVTLGAEFELRSERGTRRLPAKDFFLGAMTTALAPDEMIHSLTVPKVAPGTAFRLFNRRHGDFAIVAVAVALTLAEGRVIGLHLGVGGAEAVPRRLESATAPMLDRQPDAAWLDELQQAVHDEIRPVDDGRIEAAYRRELTVSLTRAALVRALERARQGATP